VGPQHVEVSVAGHALTLAGACDSDLWRTGSTGSGAGTVLGMLDGDGWWVTIREAARLLGVHRSAVPKMVRRGYLTPRKRRRPSLRLADVLELAEAREEAARVRALPPVPKEPVAPQPPDEVHDWVEADVVAEFLGVQPAAVRQRTRRGRLPHAVGPGAHVLYQLDQVAMTVHSQQVSRGLKCKCPPEWAHRPPRSHQADALETSDS
jgi:hypothetical protein